MARELNWEERSKRPDAVLVPPKNIDNDDNDDNADGTHVSKDAAGEPQLMTSGLNVASILDKAPPFSSFYSLGTHRGVMGGDSPSKCLDVPKLDIPAGTPANDRILIAAKYFADNLLGAHTGDPRLSKFGIDSSHAWCAETMNAILRAAGLKDSGSALALSMANVGKQVSVDDIQAGDFVAHNRGNGHGHTGLVWKVNKDAHGHVASFVMLNGNHGGKLAFSQVNNPAGYATYSRHDGTMGPHAPTPTTDGGTPVEKREGHGVAAKVAVTAPPAHSVAM
jgi:hypothetical protein